MNTLRKWITLRRVLVALVVSTTAFLASYFATISANTPSRPYTSNVGDKVYLTLPREQLTATALEIARGAGLVGDVVEQQITEVSMGEWDETFDQIEGIRDPGRPVFIFALRGEIDWNRGINIGFVAPEDPNNPRPTLTPTPPSFYDAMTLVLDSQTGNGMAFYPHVFISAPLSPPRLEQILALSATPIPVRVVGTEPPPGYWETLTAPESQMTAQVYYWLTRTANAEAGTIVSTPQPDGSLVPLPPAPDVSAEGDLRQP